MVASSKRPVGIRGNYRVAAWPFPFDWAPLDGLSGSETSFRLELGREALGGFNQRRLSVRNEVEPYESLDFRLGLGQPQTSRIHRSIGTSCFMTLQIHE